MLCGFFKVLAVLLNASLKGGTSLPTPAPASSHGHRTLASVASAILRLQALHCNALQGWEGLAEQALALV